MSPRNIWRTLVTGAGLGWALIAIRMLSCDLSSADSGPQTGAMCTSPGIVSILVGAGLLAVVAATLITTWDRAAIPRRRKRSRESSQLVQSNLRRVENIALPDPPVDQSNEATVVGYSPNQLRLRVADLEILVSEEAIPPHTAAQECLVLIQEMKDLQDRGLPDAMFKEIAAGIRSAASAIAHSQRTIDLTDQATEPIESAQT